MASGYERRLLTSIMDPKNRRGAFASTWLGFKNPRKRALPNLYRTQIRPVPDWELRTFETTGVYVLLHKTSNRYRVVYVGCSKNVFRRFASRWKDQDQLHYTVAYISSTKLAREYERDLICYYAPPWNEKH